MDKQYVENPYNGILFGCKKECKPWEHFAKWKKPVIKDSYYIIPFTWIF